MKYRAAHVPWIALIALMMTAAVAGCVRPTPGEVRATTVRPTVGFTNLAGQVSDPDAATPAPTAIGIAVGTPVAAQLGTPLPRYEGQPTPDSPRYDAGAIGGVDTSHVVQPGENLGYIAGLYGLTTDALLTANSLESADLLQPGQELIIPGDGVRLEPGSSFKIIPDSELVYGPAAANFDLTAFVTALDSHLIRHREEVEGQEMAGPEIVQLVADRYSVNPRLLLTALEHRAGWITQPEAAPKQFVLDYTGPGSFTLYGQLNWAANQMNFGYYGRAEGGLRRMTIGEQQVLIDPTINDGTSGVQLYLGAHEGATYDSWLVDAGPEGFFATYERLFGNPFAYTVAPLWPGDLTAPELVLPWSADETWYFTGGPHGSWNSGSAWGALDFVPPSELLGCVQSDSWVTASSPGVVVRSGNGAVVVDMDGDGFAGTGWVITYMHLESRDRAPLGAIVDVGDRLGHPSCEGGVSNGTHLHIARSYNGRWVSADGPLPFTLSGWVSQGLGREYDGLLLRGDQSREACVCREAINAITHN